MVPGTCSLVVVPCYQRKRSLNHFVRMQYKYSYQPLSTRPILRIYEEKNNPAIRNKNIRLKAYNAKEYSEFSLAEVFFVAVVGCSTAPSSEFVDWFGVLVPAMAKMLIPFNFGASQYTTR